MTGDLVEMTADRLAAGGAGVARHEGKVCFVHGLFPGETGLVRIVKRHARFDEGELARLIESSPDRVEPACPVAGECGGCPWMGLAYPAQLAAKREIVADAFARIARIPVEVAEPVAADRLEGYRGRIRLHVRSDRGGILIGYLRPRSRDLVPVDRCPIAVDPVNAALAALREHAAVRPADLAPFGQVEIEAGDDGTVRLELHPREGGGIPEAERILEGRAETIAGVSVRHRKGRTDRGETVLTRHGLGGVPFFHGPGSFTQTNPSQNLKLVEQVRALLGPVDGVRILDLYCGIGNYALPLALEGGAVTGVDRSRADIDSAERSAAAAGAMTVAFERGDAGEAAARMKAGGVAYDAVLLNPPRTGAAEAVEPAAGLGAERIVYVSCDPGSLARDVALFSRHSYRPEAVAPVDLFPHTPHVETVTLLRRG